MSEHQMTAGSHDDHAHGHDVHADTMFGFWIFMMSDLVIFSLLFATYASMSVHGIAHGPAPHDIYEMGAVFGQTMCLLASSVTFGIAWIAMKYDRPRKEILIWTVVTFILGLGFLGLEIEDWSTMIHEHGAAPQTSGFLSSFYLLTATHFVHVSGGLIWMAILVWHMFALGTKDPVVKLRMERLSVFWHLLDVVWIGIFTFVFLYGVVS